MTPTLHVPQLDPDVDTLSAALAYAHAGWYVLPVRRGTKHPGSLLGKSWQYQSSHDPETLVAWFAGADHGIALHVGRSGAVAFDVDYLDRVPGVLTAAFTDHPAPTQSSRPDQPGRGHRLYAVPPGRVLGNGVGRLGGEWGEVRGKNGVIIVAPSIHEDAAVGAVYRWEQTGVVPVLPASVADLLDDAEDAEDAATDAEVTAFLDTHTGDARPELLTGWVTTFTAKVAAGESRHQRMISVAAGAMKEAHAGYFPARKAAEQLEQAFLDAVSRPPIGQQRAARTGGIARSEWAGILAWAIAQAGTADLEQVHERVNAQMPKGELGFVPFGIDPDTGELTGDPRSSPGVGVVTREDMRPPDDGRDGKTDSHVAQTIAVHVLAGRYHWAHGLGWMWLADGASTWRRVPDEAVHDDARRYLLARYRDAVADAERVATTLAEAEAERDQARGDLKAAS